MSNARNKTKSTPKAAQAKPKAKPKPVEVSSKAAKKKPSAKPETAIATAGTGSAVADVAIDAEYHSTIATTESASVMVAPPGAPAPRARDPRLPAVGTIVQKRDRAGAVRCSCEITETGVVYAGKTFGSLSSAAVAAARDLGLGGKSQNGYVFWGVIPVTRRPREPMASIERAWTRYRGQLDALVQTVTDENRAAASAKIREHVEHIQAASKRVA